jgi:hypothetical protein
LLEKLGTKLPKPSRSKAKKEVWEHAVHSH